MVQLVKIFHAILYLKYFAGAIPFDFDQTRDNVCYDKKTSAPVYCKTDFIDPISTYSIPMRVAEICDKSSPRCSHRNSGHRSRRRSTCGTCNTNIDNIYSPRFLTDLHNENNVTCWRSNPFPFVENQTGFHRNITLTLSLKKRYQLYFFAVIFCTKLPETMIIYKSKDKGRNWIPYHYYSNDCVSTFNINPGTHNEQPGVAPCTENHASLPSSDRIIINPNNSGKDMADLTAKEYEWASITDIKIEIMNPLFIYDTHTYNTYNRHMRINKNYGPYSRVSTSRRSEPMRTVVERSASVYYGISHISMGGRCQCNGHASVCNSVRGKTVCECEHNTAGPDCDRCKFFHFDRPWQRATNKNANPCVACNCNRHSTECEFDASLYMLSGNVSGGVCVNCRHNTAGRYCHECKNGYFKNHLDITYSEVCSPCRCNTVGSALEICNRTTGQCPCKEHATGRRCQRCSPGFQQTGNGIAPCIKIPATNIKPAKCPKRCELLPKRQIKFRKYCRKNFVFEGLVHTVKTLGDWVKYKIEVRKIWKKTSKKGFRRRKKIITMQAKPCNCSKLKLRPAKNYIIFSSHSTLLESIDSIVPSRNDYKKKLTRFHKRSKRC